MFTLIIIRDGEQVTYFTHERRRLRMVELECYKCRKVFKTDADLDNRLKISSILHFPNSFWNLCDKCKEENFSYTRDAAVAYQLVEGTCTEHELLSVGLNREDLKCFKQAGIDKWNIDYQKSSRHKTR